MLVRLLIALLLLVGPAYADMTLLGAGNGGGSIGTSGGGVPVNTVLPAITRTPQVGQSLSLNTGKWSKCGGGCSYATQWYSNGIPIAGATGLSYTPVAGDVGHTITAAVIATNGAGASSPGVPGQGLNYILQSTNLSDPVWQFMTENEAVTGPITAPNSTNTAWKFKESGGGCTTLGQISCMHLMI